MQHRHDLHIAANVTSTLGGVFAAGPLGVLAALGVVTLGCLCLAAVAEPGLAFAIGAVLILPVVAWRVGRHRPRGRYQPTRLLASAALVGVAAFAYQAQWGALGARIDEGKAKRCDFANFDPLSFDGRGTSWFLDCRKLLTRDQVGQACTRLKSYPETKTIRLTLVCD